MRLLMKLLVATRNKHKLREIREILAELDLDIVSSADIAGLTEVVEDATTIRDNAIKKAVETARFAKMLTLADDSGLEVDALTRGVIQDELLKICSETQQTVFMITHDVDEAILLSDKIMLMSNGPNARIAEIVINTLPKNRKRASLHHDPMYYPMRNHLVDFLVNRSKHWQATEMANELKGFEPLLVKPGIY